MHHSFDLLQKQYRQQILSLQTEQQRATNAYNILNGLASIVRVFFRHVSSTHDEGSLSIKSRQARLKRKALLAEQRIRTLLADPIAEMDARIAEINSSMTSATAGGKDDAVKILLKIEARRFASNIDPLTLHMEYLKLCHKGQDDLCCEALEEAPSFFRLLPDEIFDEGRQIRAARICPDLAEDLRQVRVLREILACAASEACRQLALYLPDPIAKAA